MKTATSVIALLICTCLALGLIVILGQQSHSGPDAGNSGASTTEAAPPAQNAAFSYAAAAKEVQSVKDLAYTYTYELTRMVGGETYSESRIGTAAYTGLHTGGMEALITEDIAYGSYSTRFTESYLLGKAYSNVRGTSFTCEISSNDFLARQIPAAPLTESLYSSQEISTDRLNYTYSDAAALESWADPTGEAVLITAVGNAKLDGQGHLASADYHAEYTLGGIPYTLDVTVTVTSEPDLSAQPEYPADCPIISDLEIPRYMIRTVDGVYSAIAASSEYTESVYFGVMQEWITESGGYYFAGSGENFVAKQIAQSSRTTSTGSSASSSLTNIFRDGQYSCSVNGGDPSVNNIYTGEQIRNLYADNILSVMMTLTHIGSATVTDNGDFLLISFDGNDAFIQYFSGNIYSVLGFSTPLEDLSESSATSAAGGYLTINKYTGLPTAMGLSLKRSYVMNSISYDLTYQRDQSLTLACPNAFETITGTAAQITAEETVKPLFYQVTGADGQKLWLLGTMEIGDRRSTNLPTQILEALRNAAGFALEYDADAFAAAVAADPNLQAQVSAAYYDQSVTTGNRLPEDLYSRMYPLTLATGLRNVSSDYLKPVIWQSQIENLYLTQGYSLNASGCSRYLLSLASELELPIHQMDSGLAQTLVLTELSDDIQAMLLNRLLDLGLQGYNRRVQQEYDLWCKGDEAGLLALAAAATEGMSEDDKQLYDAYYQAVVTDRTRIFLDAAIGYLESGETVFCTVNVDRLLGENGLVEALRAAGYTVEAVQYE